ncbi:erythromycin esterase family protein [Kitasatospora sp. NPDC048298]|uniref:erythromycin esterase family protein n=1 Tax=Kitasatospora sp. NPDC048298 TaxID=3364049 RepID=UPI0037115CF4
MSAHDDHAGYATSDPVMYPESQGSILRGILKKDYLVIGASFDQGSFLSKDKNDGSVADTPWKKWTVGPAAPDTNEYTLDQIRFRDYYVDLRKAPPAAKEWLNVARPTYSFGAIYPADKGDDLAVGQAYDVLVHLHSVREAGTL